MAPTVKHHLPLFSDFINEFTTTWPNPHASKLMLHGRAPFMELEGMEGAGLVHTPPVDRKLAGCLTPLANKGVANANLCFLTSTVDFGCSAGEDVSFRGGGCPISVVSVCCRSIRLNFWMSWAWLWHAGEPLADLWVLARCPRHSYEHWSSGISVIILSDMTSTCREEVPESYIHRQKFQVIDKKFFLFSNFIGHIHVFSTVVVIRS